MFCFVVCQVSILNKEENKRDTIVDRVFRKALEEFHMQLISSYSVLMKVRPLSESVRVSILFTVHCALVFFVSSEKWVVHQSSHLSAAWRFWSKRPNNDMKILQKAASLIHLCIG